MLNQAIASTARLVAGTSFRIWVGIAAAISLSAPAYAQQSDDSDEFVIDVIVVTATKREQTLQDTPVAVSVVTAEQIERAEIQDLNDLQSIVPSLQVRQLASTANTTFFIRGFGNGSNNAGIEPSVGVFVDGVYRSRSAAQIVDLPGLQRVEVLRGPQSTLFGKNASVGVVSIVTKKPEFENTGSLSLTAGNFDTLRLKGDITGPISDSVAFRLSGGINSREGYADNLETGGDLNDRDRWAVQGQLLFRPSDSLSVRVSADYDKIDEGCCLVSNVVSGPVTDQLITALGDIVREDPFSFQGYANFDPINEIDNGGISLHIEKDFAATTLTSITAHRTVDSLAFGDADATSVGIATSFNDSSLETFTQEFRLTSSSTDTAVDWMLGGFYFDESLDTNGEFLYDDDFRVFADALFGNALTLAEGLLGVPSQTFGQSGQGAFETRGQDNTSWSIFGTLDWHMTDSLTATFGVNYTEDEKDAFMSQVNTDVFSGLDFVAIGVLGLGLTPEQAQNPMFNPLRALRPLQFIPPFLDFPNAVENGKSEDSETTYTLRLQYDLSDNVNAYASFATGFKATSWNLSRDSRPLPQDFIPGSPVTSPPPSPIRDAGLAVANLDTGTRFAGPEDVEVIELGIKAQFERLALNVAVFDQQVEGFQSSIFTGTGFAFSNAGEQSTTGLEVDATWLALDNLTLRFGGTYLDAEYDSFENSPVGDLTGVRPAGTPELTTSTSVIYDFALGNLPGFFRADWLHSSDTTYFDSPTNQALIAMEREYDLVNTSLGFATPIGVDVTIWARNLLDEEFIGTAFPSLVQSGSISGYPNEPRTWGVTLRKNFD